MANAVVPDKVGNIMTMIIPFRLYNQCIQDNAHRLKSISDCSAVSGTYNIMEVPKLFSQ